ncbi:MAG: DUF2279 domain-containing protein [Bacteroidota bacterium]
MKSVNLWLLFLSLFIISLSQAQDSTSTNLQKKPGFLDYSASLNKKRLVGVSVGGVGIYTGIIAGVGAAWYGKDKLSKFHWFEDATEWKQVDKGGHFFAPYFVTTWSYHMLRWSGMKNTPAALVAGAFGFVSMSAMEIPDGLHPKYGASWSDLVFNFAGAAFATTQFLVWKEQRILTKYSFHIVDYPKGELRDRANALYGSNFGERILKDYNGATMWLSFNLYSFNHKIKPQWLNIAFGYAAGNLYGGFENKWTDKNGVYHDRSDLKQYRRFFISIDADYTKFKTRSKAGKMILGILNIVKLPMPALEFNTLGQVVFHPMYFLNLEVPVYFKK